MQKVWTKHMAALSIDELQFVATELWNTLNCVTVERHQPAMSDAALHMVRQEILALWEVKPTSAVPVVVSFHVIPFGFIVSFMCHVNFLAC